MQIINVILIKIFSEKIGTDQIGNSYFESRRKDHIGRKRRFVVYKGIPEPTKIPSEWYSWLHHLTNLIPGPNNNSYNWQKIRESNKTGLNSSDTPPIISWTKKCNYVKWQPK